VKRKISRIHQSLAVLAAIFLVIFFAGCGLPKKADEVGAPGAPGTPHDMTCYQQLGITLSGAEWEGGDYIRPTTAELSYYASKGVKLIRLEIRWDKVQPDLYGQLNGDEITWLKTYVADADKQNMSVIIDLHERSNLDDLNFGPELPIASLADFWKKIAGQFRSISNVCGFGVANEPNHKRGFYGIWPVQTNSVIAAIRSVDNQHFVFVGEDHWDSSLHWDQQQAEAIRDPANRLVFEAHSYWDNDTSGNYSPNTPPANDGDAKQLVETNMSPFINWCGTTRRCFAGEFGVPPDKEWLVALDHAIQLMREHHIGGCYWAGGPGWGNDYPLSIEPVDSHDSVQMAVMEKYLSA